MSVKLVSVFVFFVLVSTGCNPAETEQRESETKVSSPAKQLAEQFGKHLSNQDWEQLEKLHWTGGKNDAQSLKERFSFMDEFGKVKSVFVDSHLEYDKDSYSEHIDGKSLPGPAELLKGEIEFYIESEDLDVDTLVIFAFLCEEENKLKIFDYIHVVLD
jgi:hypothetical protein